MLLDCPDNEFAVPAPPNTPQPEDVTPGALEPPPDAPPPPTAPALPPGFP
jgi:hypothetical protein